MLLCLLKVCSLILNNIYLLTPIYLGGWFRRLMYPYGMAMKLYFTQISILYKGRSEENGKYLPFPKGSLDFIRFFY